MRLNFCNKICKTHLQLQFNKTVNSKRSNLKLSSYLQAHIRTRALLYHRKAA